MIQGYIVVFCVLFLDKERELTEAQAEIRALKLSDRAREKACEEVRLLQFLSLIKLLIL